MLITVGQAVAYVVAGMYGDLSELGAGNALLIIVQVCIVALESLLKLWCGSAGHDVGESLCELWCEHLLTQSLH